MGYISFSKISSLSNFKVKLLWYKSSKVISLD